MKTAAVVIEDWKLPIFKRHLDAAKYSFTQHPEVTPGHMILRVSYEWVSELQPIIEAAVLECSHA